MEINDISKNQTIKEIKNCISNIFEVDIELIEKYPFYNKKFLNEFFKLYNVNFIKTLGQNFLIDKNIAKKIYFILSQKIKSKDNYGIEIGGGSGNLTCFIKNFFRKLYVIEYDKFYSKLLNYLYENLNIEIINEDLLKVNFENLVEKNKKYIVIGAIPYNISSKIINLLAKMKNNLIFSFLIVQKEYFERINLFNRFLICKNGDIKDSNEVCKEKKIKKRKNKEDKASFLTVFVNYHFSIEKCFDISKNSFYPIPKVDSTCFFLYPKDPILNEFDEKEFFNMVSFVFSNKRKMLINSLERYIFYKLSNQNINQKIKTEKNYLKKEKKDLYDILEMIKKDQNLFKIENWPLSRPEDLYLNHWIMLYNKIKSIINI
ncbi:MAG: hypothetical protein N3A58_08480 [Spirochaetes bacterium]|nr:hypothetical protein [Spirochaetota bacterium]